MQVVQIVGKDRGEDLAARIIAALDQVGYELRGSYMPIHLLTQITQCVWDRWRYSYLVWPALIELPCEHSVTFQDLEQITTIVKSMVAGHVGG